MHRITDVGSIPGGDSSSSGTVFNHKLTRVSYLPEHVFTLLAVDVPAGATINSAYFNFKLYLGTTKGGYPADQATVATARITAEDADNPAPPPDASSPAVTKTSAYVDMNLVWQGTEQSRCAVTTPNLAAVIQEVVSRPGWVQGNRIRLYVEILTNPTNFTIYPLRASYLDVDFSPAGTYRPLVLNKIFNGDFEDSTNTGRTDSWEMLEVDGTTMLHEVRTPYGGGTTVARSYKQAAGSLDAGTTRSYIRNRSLHANVAAGGTVAPIAVPHAPVRTDPGKTYTAKTQIFLSGTDISNARLVAHDSSEIDYLLPYTRQTSYLNTEGPLTTTKNQWVPIQVTWTPLSPWTFFAIVCEISAASSAHIYADGLSIVEGPAAIDFFDGRSGSDYRWAESSYKSPSIYIDPTPPTNVSHYNGSLWLPKPRSVYTSGAWKAHSPLSY